jgi:hypothetical protein
MCRIAPFATELSAETASVMSISDWTRLRSHSGAIWFAKIFEMFSEAKF